MSNLKYDDCIDDFLASCGYAADVPEDLLRRFLNAAVRIFTEKTTVLRDELYVTGECHMDEILLDIPDCRTLIQVHRVAYKTYGQCEKDDLYNDTWTDIPPKESNAIYGGPGIGGFVIDHHMEPNKAVQLGQTLNEKSKVYISYSFKPTRESCGVPEWFWEQYKEAILIGAKIQLSRWMEKPVGKDLQLEWENEMLRVLVRVRKRYSTGTSRMQTVPVVQPVGGFRW